MSTTEEQYRIENPLDYRRTGNGPAYDIAEYGDGQFESGFMGGNLPAWHGLGNVIAEDVVTAERAIKESGLDWEVWSASVAATLEDGTTVPMPRVKAVGRTLADGTHDAFGTVGSDYTLVQNSEAFTMMDDLVDSGDAKYHTAGSLRRGRRVWLQARVPAADCSIGGLGMDELLRLYLLMSNAHDGTGALRIDVTPVRVCCENTQNLAIAGALRTWTTRHTSGIQGRVQEARKALDLTFRYTEHLQAVGEALLKQKMTSSEFGAFLQRLVPLPDGAEAGGVVDRNRQEVRMAIQQVYQLAPNLANVRGTKWAALQAVGEYSDHLRPARDGKVTTAVERRFIRNTSDGAMKNRALRLLDPALASPPGENLRLALAR